MRVQKRLDAQVSDKCCPLDKGLQDNNRVPYLQGQEHQLEEAYQLKRATPHCTVL